MNNGVSEIRSLIMYVLAAAPPLQASQNTFPCLNSKLLMRAKLVNATTSIEFATSGVTTAIG